MIISTKKGEIPEYSSIGIKSSTLEIELTTKLMSGLKIYALELNLLIILKGP